MATVNPVEVSMNLSETKQQLSKVVNSVARRETRLVVEKSGLPVAAIISVDDYRRFQRHEAEREPVRTRMFAVLERLSDAFNDVSDDDLERELAKAQAEVRAELRAERVNATAG